MTAYIIRRLAQALIVIILLTILIFLLMRLLPGDPLLLYIARNELAQLNDADMSALRVEFGLDKSLPVQYLNWFSGLFHGNFGTSLVYFDKVSTLLAERLPVTAYLGFLSFVVSSILGISAGLISGLRRGEKLDTLVTSVANLGISLPTFWLGILMIYLFGLYLHWLPTMGYTSPFGDFWLSTRKLIMPVLCLSVFPLASVARQTRSSILEVIRQDYIRTAWSKGMNERAIVIKHTLKNSLIPVLTIMGIQVSHIFGGSVLIETVFNIPGMGRLMVDAIFGQDYTVVQGGCLLIATVVVLVNLLVDVAYGWLDPRIRYG